VRPARAPSVSRPASSRQWNIRPPRNEGCISRRWARPAPGPFFFTAPAAGYKGKPENSVDRRRPMPSAAAFPPPRGKTLHPGRPDMDLLTTLPGSLMEGFLPAGWDLAKIDRLAAEPPEALGQRR